MEPAPGHGELFGRFDKTNSGFYLAILKIFWTNRTLIMSDNIYTPPKSEPLPAGFGGNQPHFMLWQQKMRSVIFFVTVGMYMVYWMYKNWSQYKAATESHHYAGHARDFFGVLHPLFI